MIWAANGNSGGEDGALRTTPSAHALYPTRVLVVAGAVSGLPAGVYESSGGALIPVADGDLRPALRAAALDDQPWVGEAPATIAIAADFDAAQRAFADQPPAGIRGERYVWLETGAMAQNMYLRATDLGLGGALIGGFDDDMTAAALHLAAPWRPAALFCAGHPANAN